MEGVWPTLDGGYIVARSTYSYGDVNGDAWLLKLDAYGNIEWRKTYGGRSNDGGGNYEEFVGEGTSGQGRNYIVARESYSFGAGESDIWIIKLDANGNILWQKAYGVTL
jgi:hypothetical protein